MDDSDPIMPTSRRWNESGHVDGTRLTPFLNKNLSDLNIITDKFTMSTILSQFFSFILTLFEMRKMRLISQ
ncbi:hypothetical protein [Bacillus smithii]|uniref:hypothetical protein n=1 Tax=Bacillus smithii TaxID=1479 RepID=UPI003D23C5D8